MKNLIREQYLNNKEKGDDILLEDAYASMYNKQPTQSITTDDVASVLDNIEDELMQMRLYINLDGRNTLQLVPLVQSGDIEAILDTLSPRISDQDGGEPHNFKMIEDMIRDAFIDIMPDGPMSESKDKKPDEDGDGVPDWADKKPGEDDNKKKKSLPPWLKKEEDEEEKLEEDNNLTESSTAEKGKAWLRWHMVNKKRNNLLRVHVSSFGNREPDEETLRHPDFIAQVEEIDKLGRELSRLYNMFLYGGTDR